MSISSDKTGAGLPAGVTPVVVLTPEQIKSRKQRNIAIGLCVGFFVILFYVVTIAKLGPGVLTHPAE